MVQLFLATILAGFALLGLSLLGVVTGTLATVVEFIGAGAVILFAIVLIVKAIMALLGKLNV
ncbi:MULTISPECIES: hypothetical protein [Heyndrickxia]|uniref:Uncharacterized protein n=1 Tax=Heyndrickxia sporothermodurans TaxID=46224 RepID=A0A150L8E1_9BACI|nr:hypothetical protein [Heyndrickxia sporothermodurans]KYD08613.1 hypothetical protein B4102_0693 [Heyndrickxia sporothermodurans]